MFVIVFGTIIYFITLQESWFCKCQRVIRC